MAKLRKYDYTIDGSEWDLSTLMLEEVPTEQIRKNIKAKKIDLSNNWLTQIPVNSSKVNFFLIQINFVLLGKFSYTNSYCLVRFEQE